MDQAQIEKTTKHFGYTKESHGDIEIAILADRHNPKDGKNANIGLQVYFCGNGLMMFNLSPEAARVLSARLTAAADYADASIVGIAA